METGVRKEGEQQNGDFVTEKITEILVYETLKKIRQIPTVKKFFENCDVLISRNFFGENLISKKVARKFVKSHQSKISLKNMMV